MGHVDSCGEGLGSVARARVRVRFLIRCTVRIILWVELVSGFKVKARERFSFRVTVRSG